MSRNVSSLDTDWENMTNIQLSANENIYFPWANNGSDSNMPYSFVMDIKKEDGWKMLFHSFTPEAESNIRYMALYNQRTGFLKVFHYLPTNVFSNNGGAWLLNFTTERPYFNHTTVQERERRKRNPSLSCVIEFLFFLYCTVSLFDFVLTFSS